MKALDDGMLIRTPGEFVAALRELRQAIAEGRLKQIGPDGGATGAEDITAISDEGPWPDYVEAYFQDVKSGRRLKLSVETYHGAGGGLEALE